MRENNIWASSLEEATGKIPFTFLNDYMFKVVLQKNKKVLKSLISACLNIDENDIADVECMNTIEPGEALPDKTYILDIKVIYNDNTIINFEMQVNNLNDWVDRSLAYLSRCYANTLRGEDYTQIKTTYQIGFLNYTLFKDSPKFFAKYAMKDTDNGLLYSSKFNLFVVDLSRLDLATEADIKSGLAYWAKVFKATTWEELKMVAEKSKNNEVKEATRVLFEYNQKSEIVEQCIRRDEFIAHEKYVNDRLAAQEAKISENEKQLEENERKIAESEKKIIENEMQLVEKDKTISEQARIIEQLKSELAKK